MSVDEKAHYCVQTVCECQALLEAELNAQYLVLHGWSTREGEREVAQANTVLGSGENFDIVWQCPRCIRNTLRTFHPGALRRAG